ncbi:MAG: succinate--CoA ligase subunit beta, partial [Kiloniellales bacterium]
LIEAGGEAADFMDIRPMASRGEIAAAYRLLSDNPRVKAILVNVYGGGILRCDTIAEGVALAVREGGRQLPLIVRAAGTNADLARQVLTSQGAKASFSDDMAEAARMAVAAARAAA